jgi:hypothetical protein
MTYINWSDPIFTRPGYNINPVGIAGCELDDRDSIPATIKVFILSIAPRPALGPAQPPFKWVSGLKGSVLEADHSPPSSAEAMNGEAT